MFYLVDYFRPQLDVLFLWPANVCLCICQCLMVRNGRLTLFWLQFFAPGTLLIHAYFYKVALFMLVYWCICKTTSLSVNQSSNQPMFDSYCIIVISERVWQNIAPNDVSCYWQKQPFKWKWQTVMTHWTNLCFYCTFLLMLWYCWLSVRKSIRPVKIKWWGVDVVICLERGADCLHMLRLMPLHPQTLSSLASFKHRLVLPFWCRLTQVVLEKRPLNGGNVVVV